MDKGTTVCIHLTSTFAPSWDITLNYKTSNFTVNITQLTLRSPKPQWKYDNLANCKSDSYMIGSALSCRVEHNTFLIKPSPRPLSFN